jgi:hypothetical protein
MFSWKATRKHLRNTKNRNRAFVAFDSVPQFDPFFSSHAYRCRNPTEKIFFTDLKKASRKKDWCATRIAPANSFQSQ